MVLEKANYRYSPKGWLLSAWWHTLHIQLLRYSGDVAHFREVTYIQPHCFPKDTVIRVYNKSCLSLILEENIFEGRNCGKVVRGRGKLDLGGADIYWYSHACSLRFWVVLHVMWLWLWGLECHHPCSLPTEISRKWLCACTYGPVGDLSLRNGFMQIK